MAKNLWKVLGLGMALALTGCAGKVEDTEPVKPIEPVKEEVKTVDYFATAPRGSDSLAVKGDFNGDGIDDCIYIQAEYVKNEESSSVTAKMVFRFIEGNKEGNFKLKTYTK